MENLFIKAVKNSYRFESTKGLLSVEDLYQLPLTSTRNGVVTLEQIARTIYNKIKDAEEVSFVEPTKASSEMSEKLDIVKYIIADKQSDNKAKLEKAQKEQEKARLKELLVNKKLEKEGELSIEEIEAKLASL